METCGEAARGVLPLLRASDGKYSLPPGYDGPVVLLDDRKETLEALKTKSPPCRFLTVSDCGQLLGLSPFEVESRTKWRQLGYRDAGRLLEELPKAVGSVIAEGLRSLQDLVLALSSARRIEALPAQGRLAKRGQKGELPESAGEPALDDLLQQRRRVACYANGLPKVGGKKRRAASLADEDTSERDGEGRVLNTTACRIVAALAISSFGTAAETFSSTTRVSSAWGTETPWKTAFTLGGPWLARRRQRPTSKA